MSKQSTLFEPAPKHDPGGKVRLAIPPHWKSNAVFSPCERYRYELSRIWNDDVDKQRLVLWILMNPSTADVNFNDPTIAKCCRFSHKWGYDGLLIGNICAYRATNNKNLPDDPLEAVGPENGRYLLSMATRASLVVVAHGQLPKRLKIYANAVVALFRPLVKLHHLRLAKDGSPWHPLYLPETVKPIHWVWNEICDIHGRLVEDSIGE
jgi:hypothetical protein